MATQALVPVVRYLRKLTAPAAVAEAADAELLARFILHRDEAAFTALVRRHGPRVLAVCRRVVRDEHAAEDAFQATFLVLARKAESLTQPELLGSWLYGVAYRTANKAKIEAARRRARERRAVRAQEVNPDDECARQDVRAVVEEEVHRLPERYRLPVVLCYLQGQTNAEAARRLGISRGSVATLLARARDKLRRQLTRRGVSLTVGAALAALTESVSAAAVSMALEQGIVKAAALLAAGQTQAAGALAAQAVALAKGVSKGMLMEKLKIPAALLMMTALVGAGAGIGVYRAGAQETEATASDTEVHFVPSSMAEQPRKHVTAPSAEEKKEKTTFRTPNFLVTAPSKETAERVGKAAEQQRKALAQLWLGKELPKWPAPCPIRVTVTKESPGGASEFAFDNGRVLSASMHLEGSLTHILADGLPHEMTHMILAYWRGQPLPRWADEGAATLSESAASRTKYKRLMDQVLRAGHPQPLRDLLPNHGYPRDILTFYPQSHSLTDFLVSSGGREKFLAFIAQGEDEGWDKAAKAHYGYKTVEVLEYVWLEHARKRLADKRNEEPLPGEKIPNPKADRRREVLKIKGRLPTSPAPQQVLVVLNEEGDLMVCQQILFYQPVTTYKRLKGNEGQIQPVTSYKEAHSTQLAIFDRKKIRVYDTKGQAVDAKELPKRLKGETLVLISADGRPVDPLHLRLYKEDTLVFVLPRPAPPPPPPASGSAVAPPLVAPDGDRNFGSYTPGDPPPTPYRAIPQQTVPAAPPPAVRDPK
jgi:RNA polymerase sigma factor (sigma-70 family)